MSNVILALWFGLIAADRIDLAGGHAPMVLTPFLVLTPLVIIGEMIRRERLGHRLVLSRRVVAYAMLTGALLCTVLLSSVFAMDAAKSAQRSALLVAQIAGTFAVCILASDRDDLVRTLAIGATLSLLGFLLFDAAEALWWSGRGPEVVRAGPIAFRFDELQSLGIFPRLGGLVGDANRAAFVLVVYFAVIVRGLRGSRMRAPALLVAAILFILSMSRSGTLTALATIGVAFVSQRRIPSLRTLLVVASSIAGITLIFVAKPNLTQKLESLASPATFMETHLSGQDESGQGHLALIERGINEGMSSLTTTAVGIGYGNSNLVLEDVFPGNKYGNFHSTYVTMYAESGIVAFLFIVAVMGAPLVFGGPWRPLVVGALAFSLFYQPLAEPIFWFLLALAWVPSERPSPMLIGESA